MIEIAICDDEIVITSKVENILEELSEERWKDISKLY